MATSRLLVQESIAPQFIEAVKARFAHATTLVGNDPLSPTTAYGPMADRTQFERVLTFIEKGRQGGEPIIGGHQKGTKGFFIEPTTFVNPDKNSTIFKDEIFGPVLNIRTFKTEEEAIEIANDTNTGLSGIFLDDPIAEDADFDHYSSIIYFRHHTCTSCLGQDRIRQCVDQCSTFPE